MLGALVLVAVAIGAVDTLTDGSGGQKTEAFAAGKDPGRAYTWIDGHFTAVFPSTPTEKVESQQSGDLAIDVHTIHTTPGRDHHFAVSHFVLPAGRTWDVSSTTLTRLVDGVVAASGISSPEIRDTTYGLAPAKELTYRKGTVHYRDLVFVLADRAYDLEVGSRSASVEGYEEFRNGFELTS